ncbi:MAG: glycosyltransferase [Thiobacillus sp.]|nr:glycosyltransferase [Thiobacillus sp.]
MNGKPLRVLHVLGELKPSGAETMLVAAAPLFQAEGLMLEVLSTGASTGPHAKRFEAAGYRLHHIPFSRSPGFFFKVRRLMRAGQYDVIHLHVEAANFWYGLIARSVRPPVVLRTIHNTFAFSGNLRQRRGIQRRLLHWLGVRHVSISASVRDTELRHYRLPTTLVWNWYDSKRFTATSPEARLAARAGFGLAENEFVIASIGNCSQVKNHTAIIQAMAMLPAEQRPVYLHAGIEEAGEPERELARQLGVADWIRFLGGVDDVLPLLQAADAYVMPSIYEGFGIAAIEALATGLPALFSDVAGLRDFRADFPHLVYTGTGAGEVAAGLQTLMHLPDTYKRDIQQRYPAIARQRFGMERGTHEYLALYREGTLAARSSRGEAHA